MAEVWNCYVPNADPTQPGFWSQFDHPIPGWTCVPAGGEYDGGTPDTPPPPPPEPDKPLEYIIPLPGLQDIIRIPPLEDSALRRERFKRMHDSQTVIPQPLQWIPGVINWLDDAQDLLITGLLIARPLLIRLPLRFVPYVGWVLLANDILNLGTGLLSTALGGRSFKRATLQAMATIAWRRERRVLGALHFLKNGIPWFPALAQGGQALQTLTGYGISLGAVMGFFTNAIWGSLRWVVGQKVTIAGFPKNDALSKGYRVLAQSWQLPFTANILSREDRDLVLAAGAVATQLVREANTPGTLVTDWQIVQGDTVPLPDDRFKGEFLQWLQSEGIPHDPDKVGGGVVWNEPTKPPTIGNAITTMASKMVTWEDDQKERFGEDTHETVMSMVYNDQAQETLNWAGGSANSLEPIYSAFEQDLAAMIEFGILPKCFDKPSELAALLQAARTSSQARGLTRAGFNEIKDAANTMCGGFTRINPKTFVPES